MDSSILKELGINKNLIKDYIGRVKNGDRIVTVAGRFSSGKSSFINCFINRSNFLEVANAECTPIMVELIKDSKEKILVKYCDGRQCEEKLSHENIKKYTKISKDFDKDIVGISIYSDFIGLDNKFHLIDTPGTDTPNELHEAIANMIIQKSDIVIYIFNKTIAQSDLDKINEIKKFTNEIIFVMTHADEKTDTGFIKMNTEKIEKLIIAAKGEISKVFPNPDVLVVSSKLKELDYDAFQEIRDCVKFLSKRNNEQKVRDRVKKQLTIIFEEKLKVMKDDFKIKKEILSKDKRKVEHDYKETKYKIQDMQLQLNNNNIKINSLSNNKKGEACKRLESIYHMAFVEFQNRLLDADDITDDVLEQEINYISNLIKRKIEKYAIEVTNSIINDVYDDNNKILDEISRDFGENISTRIQKPNINDFNITKDTEKDNIQRKILNIENEKSMIQEKVQFNKFKIDDLKSQRAENINDMKELKNDMINKGQYIPKYDEIKEQGFKEAGETIGNVIGQVADVAMLFLPFVGILESADMAKDAVMIGTIAADSFSKILGNSSNNSNKKSSSNKVKAKKVADVITKVGETLSIAKYSTMLGGAIGNLIKPDRIVKKENEEYRLKWQTENDKLRQALADIMISKNELERTIEESNISIIEAMNKEKQLEQEKLRLENELKKHEEQKQREFEINSRKKIKTHYNNEIKRILDEELDISKQCIDSLIDKCSELTIVRSKKEFNEKLNSLSEIINTLENNKKSIDDDLEKIYMLIKETENYKDWIEEWIK